MNKINFVHSKSGESTGALAKCTKCNAMVNIKYYSAHNVICKKVAYKDNETLTDDQINATKKNYNAVDSLLEKESFYDLPLECITIDMTIWHERKRLVQDEKQRKGITKKVRRTSHQRALINTAKKDIEEIPKEQMENVIANAKRERYEEKYCDKEQPKCVSKETVENSTVAPKFQRPIEKKKVFRSLPL